MADIPNLTRSGCSLNSNPHFHADGVAALRTRTRIFMLDRASLYHHTTYLQDLKILCLVTSYTQLPILSRGYFDTVSSLLLLQMHETVYLRCHGEMCFFEIPNTVHLHIHIRCEFVGLPNVSLFLMICVSTSF